MAHAVRRIPHMPGLARRISTVPPARTPPVFSMPPPARRRFEYAAPEPPEDTSARSGKLSTSDRRPTNRQIPFSHVFVLDPATNKLSPTKQALKDLLETHTRERRVVELVASSPHPIVRITTRAEVEARYRDMRRALKCKAGEEPKEVQFTWGVASADLEHKLRKAARDLGKGYRVAVAVLMKKGHRPPNRGELVAFADEIAVRLAEAGEEWKEREFSGRLMVLSFQGIRRDAEQ